VRPARERAQAVEAPRKFMLRTAPKFATFSVDNGPVREVGGRGYELELGPGPHSIRVSKSRYLDKTVRIGAEDEGGELPLVELEPKPGSIKLACSAATGILVDGKLYANGAVVTIQKFDQITGEREIAVDFEVGGRIVPKTVTVGVGEIGKVVSCDGS
jgi:hypothetical protein